MCMYVHACAFIYASMCVCIVVFAFCLYFVYIVYMYYCFIDRHIFFVYLKPSLPNGIQHIYIIHTLFL